MTTPVPPADTYVSVEMRWALVRAGDVVLDPNGAPWMVAFIVGNRTRLVGHGRDFDRYNDPEQTVRVLVPWPEASGIVMLREGLGPVRVLDRGEVA